MLGGALSRAVGGQFLQPVDYRAVAAMAVDEAVQGVTTEPPAFGTLDPKHRQSSEQVSERGADRAGLFARRSITRLAASPIGFLTLTQSAHRPDRYGRLRRFATMPSAPSAHACR